MCAVGVVNATSYGYYTMILKIINLYLFASWIVLNNIDNKNPKLPYTQIKFAFFIIIYLFLVNEILLEFMEFYSLDPAKIVSCCGTVFSATSNSSISTLFNIPNRWIVSIFYINFFAILLSYFTRKKLIFVINNILFIFTSIFSLIKFFGTYIYEIPTHHCPFCMLQKDYHYIGYVLYISLFIGTFSAIGYYISKEEKYKKTSLLFDTIYTFLVSLYPLIFFIKNGVWL